MANRTWLPPLGSLEVGTVTLYCSISVGATGAVSSFTGKGIASVVRNSAGNYTITLSDQYNSLLWGACQLLDATASNPTTVATTARIASASVTAATPTVVIAGSEFTDGAAADFRNGATVMVKLDLKNSTV